MGKIFVCRCEDVVLTDIEEAIALGHDDLESIKRWTGFGTGVCQGKTCIPLVREILARQLDAHAAKSGHESPTQDAAMETFEASASGPRPPFSPRPPTFPIALGALATLAPNVSRAPSSSLVLDSSPPDSAHTSPTGDDAPRAASEESPSTQHPSERLP